MPHYKFNIFFTYTDAVETVILANCPSEATAKSMEDTGCDGYYFGRYLDGMFANYYDFHKISLVEEVKTITVDDSIVQYKFIKKDDEDINYEEVEEVEDAVDQEDNDSIS